jgi:hypothetical protein
MRESRGVRRTIRLRRDRFLDPLTRYAAFAAERTTSTEQGACRAMLSETLPSISRSKPFLP